MSRAVLSLTAALLLATGCQEAGAPSAADDDVAADAATAAVPPPATSRPDPVADIGVHDVLPPLEGDAPSFTTDPAGADVASTGEEAPILRAVRIGQHEGFDRIVFEFDSDGLPQWHAAYLDAAPADCGTGEEVALDGDATLQVRFSGANAHTPEGEGTSGPRRRAVEQPSLRELVRTCDFEAEVTWVAGIAGRKDYRPRVLDAPARLVIDISH